MIGFADSGQSSAGSPASMSAHYSSPWSMSGNHFDSLSLAAIPSAYGGAPVIAASAAALAAGSSNSLYPVHSTVATAAGDTIDPSILAQVETNLNQEEYIWSPVDTSLYEVGNARAIQAMSLPGAIRMVFPVNTMIMAWEKDGSLASPAFRPLHPHSNQWYVLLMYWELYSGVSLSFLPTSLSSQAQSSSLRSSMRLSSWH
jgi:hypothetical protein